MIVVVVVTDLAGAGRGEHGENGKKGAGRCFHGFLDCDCHGKVVCLSCFSTCASRVRKRRSRAPAIEAVVEMP